MLNNMDKNSGISFFSSQIVVLLNSMKESSSFCIIQKYGTIIFISCFRVATLEPLLSKITTPASQRTDHFFLLMILTLSRTGSCFWVFAQNEGAIWTIKRTSRGWKVIVLNISCTTLATRRSSQLWLWLLPGALQQHDIAIGLVHCRIPQF